MFAEIRRVCKPGGKVLIISRGVSKLALINEWLKLKAARDLVEYGSVEHLDFDKIIERQPGFKVVHKERKSFGMTYIFLLENEKEK